MIFLMTFFMLTIFLVINKANFRFVVYASLSIFTSIKITDGLMGRRIRDDF